MAGNGTYGYSGDGGQATAAELAPAGVTLDVSGNLYISDAGNNVIRKVNTAGIITTVVGNGTQGYNGDGADATAAELYNPVGVFFNSSGNMFIADENNNVVRKVNTAGIISTIAGNGTIGFSGDGGQAIDAELTGPAGLTFDSDGNLYIADSYNNRIRKVALALTLTVNSATICTGGTATLTVSGASTYSWSPATGLSATSGSTKKLLTPYK